MRHFPTLLLALCVVILPEGPALSAPDEGLSVQVSLKDGNILGGPLLVDTLEIDVAGTRKSIVTEEISQITPGDPNSQVLLRTGEPITGALLLKSWKVKTKLGEMEIEMSKIAAITIVDSRPPPPPPLETPPPIAGMNCTRSVRLDNVALVGLQLSADESALLALDVATPRVLVIDAATLRRPTEIPLPSDLRATKFTVSPSGRRAFAFGDQSAAVIDLTEKKVERTCALERWYVDVLAADDDQVYVLADFTLRTLDTRKQSIVATLDGPFNYLTPAGALRYLTASGTVLLPDSARGSAVKFIPVHPFGQVREKVHYLADGKHAVGEQGIYRVGRCDVANLSLLRRIQNCELYLEVPGGKSVLLKSSSPSTVEEYSLETLEVVKSWEARLSVSRAITSQRDGAVYLLGSRGGGSVSVANVPAAVSGDLYKYETQK